MELPMEREEVAAIRLFKDDDFNNDSARKRRKYVPGGPGGGGRFMAAETPARGNGSRETHSRRGRSTLAKPAPATRPRRERKHEEKPTFDSAADAAAAAAVQMDGYKPREERGWEEFHPSLNIEVGIAVFSADEVDGVKGREVVSQLTDPLFGHRAGLGDNNLHDSVTPALGISDTGRKQKTPFSKRRPGRPPRRPESMLTGLGSPPAPKIVPIPTHNPRERLNLPKPSYRKIDPFEAYEADQNVQVNFVDKSLAHVGYQESDIFARPQKTFIRLEETVAGDDDEVELILEGDGAQALAAAPAPTVGIVEYDMDEQDNQWLEAHNIHRKSEDVEAVKPAIFEITITQIEKEWHALEKRIPKPNPKPPQTHRPRSGSAAAVNGEPAIAGEEQDSKCAICDDGDCENTNAIVFCDGCDLAVHQECYGVPFIPEGQWLCRKCQMVGRNVPTCIFCPNTDGAFKLTTESRWSHLICAIWIPEVSLGNSTFMEPVMDVAKVPKQRWKLTCYICNQKMGACIQCGNRNCFQAFHVTCARRAKLFLKMKASHGGPASADASVLKALCDKHVPSEWRREHNVDEATAEAKQFYRHTMRGRKWADSQQSALALVPSQPVETVETVEDPLKQEDGQVGTAAQKRKRQQAQKNVWRLPSGAPIVPAVVFNAVEIALQRYGIRKRKEYVAEACKYWTLKREARRGAALLKRLQLQMKTFTSSEITRRDFAAMGSAGLPKLERRINLAESLLKQMSQLQQLCDDLRELQRMKLQDAELLKGEVDTIYTPLVPLMWPILERAQSLDPRGIFAEGLGLVRRRLETRYYVSVAAFASDLGASFRSVVGLDLAVDSFGAQNPPPGSSLFDGGLSLEQKEVKRLAKRVVKALQQPLAEAIIQEAHLTGKPFAKELEQLTAILSSTLDRNHEDTNATDIAGATVAGVNVMNEDPPQPQENPTSMGKPNEIIVDETTPNGSPDALQLHVELKAAPDVADLPLKDPTNMWQSPESMNEPAYFVISSSKSDSIPGIKSSSPEQSSLDLQVITGASSIPGSNQRVDLPAPIAPITPPRSENEVAALELPQGGVPWYLEPFDPVGTTIHEERWTGREVLRDMSEELSEIDEEELRGMGEEVDDGISGRAGIDDAASAEADAAKKAAAAKRRKRYRRFR